MMHLVAANLQGAIEREVDLGKAHEARCRYRVAADSSQRVANRNDLTL